VQPIYFQGLFVFDRIKALAREHPEWKEKEPFASVLKGDLKGDSDWPKGAGKARHLPARSQGVKKADRRDKYSARIIPRRMELYNSPEYLRYLIHVFHDIPLVGGTRSMPTVG
jgi:hypothetical protein